MFFSSLMSIYMQIVPCFHEFCFVFLWHSSPAACKTISGISTFLYPSWGYTITISSSNLLLKTAEGNLKLVYEAFLLLSSCYIWNILFKEESGEWQAFLTNVWHARMEAHVGVINMQLPIQLYHFASCPLRQDLTTHIIWIGSLEQKL